MVKFVARKERKPATPIAAHARPPPCTASKAAHYALCVKAMGVVVPAASAASDPWACPSRVSVITAPS